MKQADKGRGMIAKRSLKNISKHFIIKWLILSCDAKIMKETERDRKSF